MSTQSCPVCRSDGFVSHYGNADLGGGIGAAVYVCADSRAPRPGVASCFNTTFGVIRGDGRQFVAFTLKPGESLPFRGETAILDAVAAAGRRFLRAPNKKIQF